MKIPIPSLDFRFTLQKKIILAFIVLGILFGAQVWTTRNAVVKGEGAVNDLLWAGRLVTLTQKSLINLTRAGKIPKELEVATRDIGAIEERIQGLRDEFAELKNAINKENIHGEERFSQFIRLGEDLYGSLTDLPALRRQMLVYFAEYKGQVIPIPYILTERELGHIQFVKSLADSVERKARLTGGMDYRECQFYRWYTENVFKDEDLTEIFEEIDPLHQALHNYAAQIDARMGEDDFEGARDVLHSAEDDLRKLGLFFSGLRNLAADKYSDVQEEFNRKYETLEGIYARAAAAAGEMEHYVDASVQQAAFKQMVSVSRDSRRQAAGILAIGACLIVIVVAATFWTLNRTVSSLRSITGTLNGVSANFQTMAGHLAENAGRTLDLTGEAADAVGETASDITEMEASIAGMKHSIQHISSYANTSNTLVEDAKKAITASSKVVDSLKRDTEEINASSSVIQSIAFQINILSLNANVEAARAGEAGQGFAVVASEVKNLAASTATAAERITTHVGKVMEDSRKTGTVMDQVVRSMQDISQNFATIAAAVEEQSAISNELHGNMQKIVNLAESAAGNMQNVSIAADDTHTHVAGLHEGGKKIAKLAAGLRTLTDKL